MDENRYVLATKKLMEGRHKVGFMYRDEPERGDSGWRFFCGDEDQSDVDNAENIVITDIGSILGIDQDIRMFLDAPCETAYEREPGGVFRATPITAGRPRVSKEMRDAAYFDMGLAFKCYFGKLIDYSIKRRGTRPKVPYNKRRNPKFYVTEKDEGGYVECEDNELRTQNTQRIRYS